MPSISYGSFYLEGNNKMNLFQLILLLSLLFLLVIVSISKTVIIERLITLLILIGGILFVIFPDFSTRIANFVGIGRGADFVFYVFIFFASFQFITFSTRIRRIDKKITLLTRKMATSTPQIGKGFNKEDIKTINNQ